MLSAPGQRRLDVGVVDKRDRGGDDTQAAHLLPQRRVADIGESVREAAHVPDVRRPDLIHVGREVGGQLHGRLRGGTALSSVISPLSVSHQSVISQSSASHQSVISQPSVSHQPVNGLDHQPV